GFTRCRAYGLGGTRPHLVTQLFKRFSTHFLSSFLADLWNAQPLVLHQSQRVGAATGGASLDPLALATPPSTNRLHPLSPETRSRKSCRSSSMHSPSVVLLTRAFGSICHHLQSLHRPQSLSGMNIALHTFHFSTTTLLRRPSKETVHS